ncbi:hypothetical protein [Winogradskyella immobilis]|uniref:Lipocalin-like domain-containing protein n=1 Tax=Winogradskyella immobilis TaxID=2816852 RepID=A0ABS8EQJ1_9FLAO|nr:hypothetical protein [Winogradskyella immobilis]MCC1485509.1 hypothetical protein [Winogradskyella immobilis]MCG0017601.1 hypothetical protein [Winogradskyella immobilis]
MKTKFKSLLVLPFFVALLFMSCQDEIVDVIEPTEAEAIVANSELSSLVQATATFDGSRDNIIDRASCLSVQLPVTVLVNGVEIIIDSEEDFAVVEAIFDEFDDDDDDLEIMFPITIILSDHSTIEINNQEELNRFIEECAAENEEDDDIECIDFVYPFSVSVFNDESTVINVISIDNDRELFRFIQEVRDGLRASINYPVSLELADGTQVQVNNNAELVNTIRSARAECDEDDDNDFTDDDFTQERLEALLAMCPWEVTAAIRDGNENTDVIRFLLNFRNNGNVIARTANGAIFRGTWETRVTDNGALVLLEFEAFGEVFNLEWIVNDISEDRILFFTDAGNRIRLIKNCDLLDETIDRIEDVLQECFWRITRIRIDNNDNEADFVGTPLLFQEDGQLLLRVNGQFLFGTWDVSRNGGRFVLTINLNDRPNISFQWNIVFLDEDRFVLDGENIDMVIRRFCEDNVDEDVIFIRNAIFGGDWEVTLYEDGSDDETDNYNGYAIDFEQSGALFVEGNGNTLEGSWLAYRDDEGELRLGTNFGTDDDPFDELTQRWNVVSVTTNRIELIDRFDIDGTENRLVLERN